MKAIVTGATGLVGYHVVNLLLKDDEFTKVLALGRNKERLAELNELGAIAHNFDLTSEDSFELLNDWGEETFWFHCAAAVSGADKPVLHAVNVEGTERLVRKAESLKVPKFVHVSSIAVYGIQDKDYVEDDSFKPESNYGKTKLQAENIVTSSK
jgi:nucleoside-diphosphate-sugar epimerase